MGEVQGVISLGFLTVADFWPSAHGVSAQDTVVMVENLGVVKDISEYLFRSQVEKVRSFGFFAGNSIWRIRHNR
jgi:hypothetical protein